MKIRNKPVIIEAIQWKYDTIANIDEIGKFIGYIPKYCDATLTSEKRIIIKTLEGEHKASLGDWIIKGIKGEFYPCKPDIFKETYEEVKKCSSCQQTTNDLVETDVKGSKEYLCPSCIERVK